MFVVVRAAAIPSHVRGYLDRFLVEVASSVYVGPLSKRVADELWDALESNQEDGDLVMVLSTADREQGYEVRLSGESSVRMIDFDGVWLPRWDRKVASHAH